MHLFLETAIYKSTMWDNWVIKGFCLKTNNERDEVRTRDAKATLFTLCGAYCQNTLHSPDKTFTLIKNMVLITTDVMHHGTFSTGICCGGYRQQRQMSPQLCVLLPKSFQNSCPPFCYTAQRIRYLNNFSLTVEEWRNIYKIKKVCPAWSKFKPFQTNVRSLQTSPSQLPSW